MNNKLQIPPPIADFVKAVNEHNNETFLAVFAENAVITDEGNEYQGIAAIKDWDDEKNIGANITMIPIEITERNGKTILTAEVDGNFDKTGLPDPFLGRLLPERINIRLCVLHLESNLIRQCWQMNLLNNSLVLFVQ